MTGLQRLRGQLCVLIIQRCDVMELDDIIVRCGGDNSTSLAWSCLRELDFSHNRLRKLGDSLVSACMAGQLGASLIPRPHPQLPRSAKVHVV